MQRKVLLYVFVLTNSERTHEALRDGGAITALLELLQTQVEEIVTAALAVLATLALSGIHALLTYLHSSIRRKNESGDTRRRRN